MNGSITAIFERCSQEIGHSLRTRGKFSFCPFHSHARPTLGLDESKGAWHCFSGSCPHPSGGILQAPVAFGFVSNRSDASRWLSERNLIPPPDKLKSNQWEAPEKRAYVHPMYLCQRQREVWREAQIDLQQAIGIERWRSIRFYNGPYHYERQKQKWAEYVEIHRKCALPKDPVAFEADLLKWVRDKYYQENDSLLEAA